MTSRNDCFWFQFNVQPDSTVMEYRGDCVICTDQLQRNIKIFKTNTNELVNTFNMFVRMRVEHLTWILKLSIERVSKYEYVAT
jgi:hypothetical protein